MKFNKKIILLRVLVSFLVFFLLAQSVFAYTAFTDLPVGDMLELNETDSSDELESDCGELDAEFNTNTILFTCFFAKNEDILFRTDIYCFDYKEDWASPPEKLFL